MLRSWCWSLDSEGGRAEQSVAQRPGPHSFLARLHAVAAAPARELVRSALEVTMKHTSFVFCLLLLLLCSSVAETQEQKEKPTVTLNLARVRGIEHFSTPLEGPRKGQQVRTVIMACDVIIDNQTGAELTVLSNFFSAFDGLSVVVLKEGKELKSQHYLFHQSPNFRERPHILKIGKTERDMRFPVGDLPANWAGLEVEITGYLPGSKFEQKLTSGKKKIQSVADFGK